MTYLFNNLPEYRKPLHFKQADFADTLDAVNRRHYGSCPYNTGVLLFETALSKIIISEEISDLSQSADSDVIITTLFHAFASNDYERPYLSRERYKYFNDLLDCFRGKLLPLNLGFAYGYDSGISTNNFLIHPELLRLLARIAERASIGCRDEFTADILSKYGIKNAVVIGCPSLFYHMNRNFTITKSPDCQNVSFNIFNWFDNFDFIQYFAHNKNIRKANYISQCLNELMMTNNGATDFLIENGHCFFDVEDWIKYIKNNSDFTLGYRFHGNVASILSGVAALTISPDSRVEGLCSYFNIPYIKYTEFDKNKPIEYYYKLTDYSDFNKNYGGKYDKFVRYLESNGVAHNL